MSISTDFVGDNSKGEIMQKMFFAVTKLGIGQINVGHSSFISGFFLKFKHYIYFETTKVLNLAEAKQKCSHYKFL